MKKLKKVKAPINGDGITQGRIYDVTNSWENDITEFNFTIKNDVGLHISCNLKSCEKLEGDNWIIVDKIDETIEKSDFKTILDSIGSLLEYKNSNYGNAVLEPLSIFAGKTKAGVRLDDKLSRIKNSETLRKNDVVDVLGYLVLICKENNWTDFDEFKD